MPRVRWQRISWSVSVLATDFVTLPRTPGTLLASYTPSQWLLAGKHGWGMLSACPYIRHGMACLQGIVWAGRQCWPCVGMAWHGRRGSTGAVCAYACLAVAQWARSEERRVGKE